MYEKKCNGTLCYEDYGEVKVIVPLVPTLEPSSQFHTPVARTLLRSLRYIFKYFAGPPLQAGLTGEDRKFPAPAPAGE